MLQSESCGTEKPGVREQFVSSTGFLLTFLECHCLREELEGGQSVAGASELGTTRAHLGDAWQWRAPLLFLHTRPTCDNSTPRCTTAPGTGQPSSAAAPAVTTARGRPTNPCPGETPEKEGAGRTLRSQQRRNRCSCAGVERARLGPPAVRLYLSRPAPDAGPTRPARARARSRLPTYQPSALSAPPPRARCACARFKPSGRGARPSARPLPEVLRRVLRPRHAKSGCSLSPAPRSPSAPSSGVCHREREVCRLLS